MAVERKQGTGVMMGVYLLSLVAIAFWGMSYLWSDNLLSKGIPVEYIVFVRILLASLFLLLSNLVCRKNIKLHKRDIPLFLLLALCEPLIYFVAETYGISLTESPTYSSLIIASGPIFSVIVGVFIFKERFSLLNLVGILVCLGGIVLVTLSSSTIGKAFWIGFVLLIVAVLSEVGNASLTKVLADRYEPVVIVMYQFMFGSIYLLPLFLTRGLAGFNAEVYLSSDVWIPLLCLAVFCSGIAFSLWANTIKYLGVAKSSIFMSTIPVCTAVAGWLLGHEYLSTMQWTGIFLSCFGVCLSQVVIRKRFRSK